MAHQPSPSKASAKRAVRHVRHSLGDGGSPAKDGVSRPMHPITSDRPTVITLHTPITPMRIIRILAILLLGLALSQVLSDAAQPEPGGEPVPTTRAA
jgi:hypothetical protein